MLMSVGGQRGSVRPNVTTTTNSEHVQPQSAVFDDITQDAHTTEPHAPDPRDQHAIRNDALLWHALRSPFALTPNMRTLHKCQWEKIDMGILGCTLCGAIHICSIKHCPTIQSNDATVCLYSGLCLTNSNIKQEDYSDRVAPYIFCSSNRPARRSITPEQIEDIVTQILLSKQARSAFDIELRRRAHRISHGITVTLQQRDATTPCNVIHLIEELQTEFTHQNKLMCDFNADLRRVVIGKVKDSISHVLNTCQWEWVKNIKPLEIRMYIVGLVYLMRSGVRINNIQVIPCVSQLTYLLPTENLLETIFHYKSKHVTDIENKFKFFFRQMPRETLLKLGFHARV